VATGLRASVAQGEGKPFILAATSRATHVAMQQFGAEAAFYVALAPLAGAVVLALMRAQ
jgi:hypothetical protein